MDVVKLQKLNSLASELRKHNFASSSDDAFKQAEQVYEQSEKTIRVESPVVERKTDSLSEHRFELLLEQQRLKYEQELGLLRSALGVLSNEFEVLKSEVRKFSEVPKVKERQEPLKTEPKVAHPRQGDFKPGDIDIQKMFYCGK